MAQYCFTFDNHGEDGVCSLKSPIGLPAWYIQFLIELTNEYTEARREQNLRDTEIAPRKADILPVLKPWLDADRDMLHDCARRDWGV